jgi:hypothetical protein
MYVLIFSSKKGWATFWAIFSQTHLVTLLLNKKGENNFSDRFGQSVDYFCRFAPVAINSANKSFIRID